MHRRMPGHARRGVALHQPELALSAMFRCRAMPSFEADVAMLPNLTKPSPPATHLCQATHPHECKHWWLAIPSYPKVCLLIWCTRMCYDPPPRMQSPCNSNRSSTHIRSDITCVQTQPIPRCLCRPFHHCYQRHTHLGNQDTHRSSVHRQAHL